MIQIVDVGLRHIVAAGEELSDWMEPFHLEVLVLDRLVRAAEGRRIFASCRCLSWAPRRTPTKGCPRSREGALGRTNVEITLQGLAARDPFVAPWKVAKGRVEWLVVLRVSYFAWERYVTAQGVDSQSMGTPSKALGCHGDRRGAFKTLNGLGGHRPVRDVVLETTHPNS